PADRRRCPREGTGGTRQSGHLPIRDHRTIATRERELIANHREPHVRSARQHRGRQAGGWCDPNMIGVEEAPGSGDQVLDPGVAYADRECPVIEEVERRRIAHAYHSPSAKDTRTSTWRSPRAFASNPCNLATAAPTSRAVTGGNRR